MTKKWKFSSINDKKLRDISIKKDVRKGIRMVKNWIFYDYYVSQNVFQWKWWKQLWQTDSVIIFSYIPDLNSVQNFFDILKNLLRDCQAFGISQWVT